jgi:hypothetical protein
VKETITAKSLHSLISTPSARDALTQKVRKAVARGVLVVDVGWIDACVEKGVVVGVEEWDVTDVTGESVRGFEAKKEAEKRKKSGDGGDGGDDATCDDATCDDDGSIVDNLDSAQWTAPVSYGCSCVCHENCGYTTVTDCKWCIECDVNVNNRDCNC